MSDGGGESIGSIVWLGFLLESEVKTDHFFHLGLAGGAVAGQSLFDFVWSVFVDFQVILFGDKKDDAASLCNHDAGGDILAKKEFFDRDDVWFGGIEDFVKRLIELEQTVGELAVFGSGDDAEIEGFCICSGSGLDEAKAAATNTGVNSKNFHDIIIAYRLEEL